MRYEDVTTWDDYKKYVREQGPEEAAVIDKCERIAQAVTVAMNALKEIHMGMYTYDLDEMPEEAAEEIAVAV
ncbi:MAG: hypothetical protein IJS28_04685 [Synergistaceae bacterium]|nr:hypothetical protein [Synergistaceae bacterium]